MSGGPKAGPALLTTDAGELALGAGFDTRRTSGLLCSRLSRPWIDSTTGARSAGTTGSLVLEYIRPSVVAAIFTPKTFCACATLPVKETSRVEASAELTVKPFFVSHCETRATSASVGPKRLVKASGVSHR